MSTAPTIELRRADGTAYSGWTEVEVTRSIEQVASTFRFRVALTDDGVGLDFVVDDLVEVWIGDTPLLTGYIDDIAPSYSATRTELEITGRSATADLVESCAPLTLLRAMTLVRIARTLADGFDLDVLDQVGDSGGTVYPRVRPEVGETCSAVIDRFAKQQGILVTDDTVGRLVLMRADRPSTSKTVIKRGVNVLEASGHFGSIGRYRTYEVKGQSLGEAEALTDSSAIIQDSGARRPRRLTIRPDRPVDSAGAKTLAGWEAVTRAGKSQSAEYTVSGWHQYDGSLWEPGILVPIDDPVMRLNKSWLITSCTWSLRPGEGRRTKLAVQPPEAFQPYNVKKPTITGTSSTRWHELDPVQPGGAL